MATALGVISFLVEPGLKNELEPEADIRLGQAVLGDVLVNNERSSLKLHYYRVPTNDDDEDEDEEKEPEDVEVETIVVANFIPGVVEHQLLGLVIAAGEKVVFESTGKNPIHISGNIILQPEAYDEPPSDVDELSEFGDSEIEAMEDESRNAFLENLIRQEEEKSTPAKAIKGSKKRPAAEADEAAVPTEAPSSTPKAAKKLKAEGGKAVPVAATEAKGKDKTKDTPKKDTPKKDKKDDKAKDAKKDDKPEEIKKKKETKSFTTSGGVKIVDKVAGTGAAAKKGKTLSMRYILKLGNGKVVDKNTNGKPFKFTLGAGEVIKGWDEGLVGMQVGGERTLEVPPQMGYGKRNSKDIPANSTLFFEVKLLDVGK